MLLKSLLTLIGFISLANGILVDAVITNYPVRFEDEFLNSCDSTMIYVINGGQFKQVKLIKGINMSTHLQYIIPCWSGKNWTKDEKIDMASNYNSDTHFMYTLCDSNYYELRSNWFSYFIGTLSKDDTTIVEFTTPVLDDRIEEEFRRKVEARQNSKLKLQSLLKSDSYNDGEAYWKLRSFLDDVDLIGFTEDEVETELGIEISNSEFKYDYLSEHGLIYRCLVTLENGIVVDVKL